MWAELQIQIPHKNMHLVSKWFTSNIRGWHNALNWRERSIGAQRHKINRNLKPVGSLSFPKKLDGSKYKMTHLDSFYER